MGKVHSILEKEVSELKGRILNNLTGLFVEKQVTDKQVELTNLYGLGGGDVIRAVDCQHKKAITDLGESFDFVELEIDILLWILCQIENDDFYYAIKVEN